ncbi:MAG: glycosyltransferase [Chthoniobacter sp.]|nr:glycosyltransferase [Chthoniobacter sp.]
MTAPLVSVIMPVHNAAPFLGEAIRSVLAQTVGDFEFILVDDASTDASAGIITSFHDPRIRCRRSDTPLNAAGARNLALAEAGGEFVAFLDADDLARRDRFEIQLKVLRERPETSVAGSLVDSIDEKGNGCGRGFVKELPPEEIAPTLLFENCLALSSVMARRAALDAFRPEFAPAEDYDLWVRLAAKSNLFIIPLRLTRYRTHAAGVSTREPDRMRAAVAAIHAAQLERLGVEPSPVHAQLSAWPLHPTMDQLAAAEQWLCRLGEANDRAALFPCAVFRRVLARRWFNICLDSWLLGWPVWRVFHRSCLAAPTFLQSLQLLRRVGPRVFRR